MVLSGHQVIYASSLMQIYIHGIPPRSSIATMFSPQRRVSILEWHPTAENVLLSASHDHSLILWNVARGDPVQVLGTWYLVLAISKVTQSLYQGDQLPPGHDLLDVVQPERLVGGDHLQGQAAQSDPA